MDFLSIRKKARERAEAKPGAPAAGPGEAPAAPAGDAPGAVRPPAPVEAAAPSEPPPSSGEAGLLERPAPSETPAFFQAPAAPVAGSPAEAAGAAGAGAPSGTPAEAPPGAEGAGPRELPFGERRRGERRRRRGDEPVLTEQDLLEGALQARFQGLVPSPDGRFATWRPDSGPPPVEPDAGPPAPRRAAQRPPTAGDGSPLGGAAPPPGTRTAAHGGRAAEEDPLAGFFYRPDEDAGSVPILGGGGGEEPVASAPEAIDEFLTFRLGGEEYGVAIGQVREVLRAPAITEVPRAPAHVLGVVTVRGEVVAVVDAHRRLGLPPGEGAGAGSRIVIVETGVGPLGLLVDGIASVVRLPAGSIEPFPQGISSAASDCVTGIGRWRDRLFMVVDVGALLGRPRAGEGR